ncbi:MAG: glycosyltransferase family 39 protein [Anaerolineae bacterium]|jgi:hypothetical protein
MSMDDRGTNRHLGQRWLSWAVLLALLVLALVLRWRYIQEISLFVDEFVTAWAARAILQRGLPIFPSGNFYPHGLVFTYLEAPFVLGEFNATLARLPALIVSLAALPVAYGVGRRLFSEPVGLIAAAALAVDPACIVWGGRARMYGLLQLLTLLVVYFYYRGLADDRPRDRYLAMGLLILAIFTHAEAAFLLPILGLATLVVMPWRRILRWSVILPFVFAGLGAVAFFLIAKFGQPGHLETLQESRPYLDLSADLLSGPRVFAPVFASLHRLPFTLLALAGLVYLFRPRFDRRSPLTYLYVVFVAFVVLIVFLAGPTWQRERYLFMVLPLFFLIGGEVLVRLLNLVPALRRSRSWTSAVLAILFALYIGLTGTRMAYVQEWGYDLAFRYLRDEVRPEPSDSIVTSMSTASMLYLGRNDAFAIQQGYEEYVVAGPEQGLPVDLWTATPMLTTTTALTDLLAQSPRVWFIADGWRFQTRYDPDFILTVLQQMDLVYEDRGVMIFRGQGYALPSQPAVHLDRRAEFDEALALTGFDLSLAAPDSGDELEVTLYWQALEQAGPAYTVLLHLVTAEATGVAGIDQPVLGGLYQPDLWPQGEALPDRHRLALPPDLPPGRYRLDLGLYPSGQPDALLLAEGADRLPLASLTVSQPAPPPLPSTPAGIDFGDQIRLLSYDLACDPGSASCDLDLAWQAIDSVGRDYTVFVHLLGPDGAIVTQADSPPGDPFFPTTTWLPGDIVLDAHTLALPAGAPPGDYTLLIGLYHQPTSQRLEARDDDGQSLGDGLLLGPIHLGAEPP